MFYHSIGNQSSPYSRNMQFSLNCFNSNLLIPSAHWLCFQPSPAFFVIAWAFPLLYFAHTLFCQLVTHSLFFTEVLGKVHGLALPLLCHFPSVSFVCVSTVLILFYCSSPSALIVPFSPSSFVTLEPVIASSIWLILI